ncbi:Hypp3410 [Branchiostoma lanceolatum]|uniref:Hypp3410 protein n=1 Tax=Branchiostoma lanceolatum TaxID=7740 RepID=A0A8K0ES12_BRALA|nr:Hypp3410 [Branchiostoma lanceolatum]
MRQIRRGLASPDVNDGRKGASLRPRRAGGRHLGSDPGLNSDISGVARPDWSVEQELRTGCPWEMLYADYLILAAETVEELKQMFICLKNSMGSQRPVKESTKFPCGVCKKDVTKASSESWAMSAAQSKKLDGLLFAASILGLCKRKDFDVVRGTCSFPGQASFMDQLLDMVCIIDSSEDATQRAMSSPGHISESRPLVEQAEADSHLMDRLSRQYTFQTMFSHKLDLLPPDIKHSVEKGWTDAGHQKGSGPDPPDVNTLLEAAARLNRQLGISTAQLHHLKGKFLPGC